MKILLINPNQYRTPPVPPLALAHLHSTLRNSPHESRILDLCFKDNSLSSLDETLQDFNPHIAGLTIRNIDTCIYQNNIFFLDDITRLVTHLKKHGIPVLLGGAGYSFIPEGILEYTGADWGICGPAENAFVHFLELFEKEPPPGGTVLDGWKSGFDPDFRTDWNNCIEFERYTSERGILGFETQKGCMENCSYCAEGNGQVISRNPECIVEDLRDLADMGFTSFHLCDTEFNQDLSHCKAFLERLIRKGPEITWVLYMKSFPYDDELFRFLKKSGADLITLSIPTGSDWLKHVAEQCRLAKKHGIKLAVDLLLGFPGETIEFAKRTIEALRKIRPDTVGVNSTIRLNPGLAITHKVTGSSEYQKHMFGAVTDNPYFIRPVFYNHLSVETLREIIGEDPLFKIEGFERTSNYERL